MSGYYASQRKELHAFLPHRVERLLDIGCGQGGFGAAVLTLHPQAEVWGVEPHAAAADVARSRLSRVLDGPFDDAQPLPDEHFDLVTFNDSLEHMTDEREALRLAHAKLRPGGRLICSLPNVRYLEHLRELLIDADWRYVDQGILDRTHLRFFTRKSMHRTVTECGFEVEGISGINSHWWSGWKIRLFRLVFGRSVEDMRWKQFVLVARKPARASPA